MFAKRVTTLLLLFACLSLTLASAGSVSPDWWKHATFYQIYPRSFKDSNNDGVGDLQGIISKLEHLRDAGVTAAWLSPIYSSPQVDQGYDISNFTDIHDEYGTLDDFKELVEKARELGVKIIMDFVPNHSSDQHEWFRKSERREAGYEDYYVWADGVDGNPPNNWISIFKYSAWQYSEIRDQYYLHQFAYQQPDLNYNSPSLVQEMKDVMTFWLDLGVSGFRVDAVPYLFENSDLKDEPLSNDPNATPDQYEYLTHIYTKDLDATFDMIYQWRQHLDEYNARHGGDARIMMTEAYTDLNHTMLYYGDDSQEGAHFTFNFFFVTDLTSSSTADDVTTIVNTWMDNMPKQRVANWVLGNHDNHRVASRLGANRVDGYNMLVSMLPGIAVTYNGEEIGMEDGTVTWEEGQDPSACNGNQEDFNETSRDFERTPFHWDNTTNAGFNNGAETWLPVSQKYLTNNLKAQSVGQIKSHYHVYKDLMELRNSDVLKEGDYSIKAVTSSTLGLVRSNSERASFVLVFNLSDREDDLDLSASFDGLSEELKVMIASIKSSRNKGDTVQRDSISLQPGEALILLSELIV